MHKSVETVIGRLATDPKLRRRFAERPEGLLRELAERGLELTDVELEALATTDPEAFRTLAEALDARLRKAPRAGDSAIHPEVHPDSGETPMSTNPNVPETAAPSLAAASTRRARRATNRLGALAALLLATAGPAQASEWSWSVTPYLWATDIGVDVKLADRQLVDRTIRFTDLIEDLEAVAQVQIEARSGRGGRQGRHGVMLDLFDARLADDGERFALPPAVGGDAVLDTEVGMTIADLAGIFDPNGDREGFELLYGVRILDQREEISGTFELASGAVVEKSYDAHDTLVDALLGVRFTKRLTPRWSVQAKVDASSGGTELTWSANPSLAWRFGKGERYAAFAGYRWMVLEFETEEPLEATMTLSGFFTGLRFSF